MSKLGPYSRADKFSKLDGRTREAKLLRETRAELVRHVGGAPSATQRALIEQSAQLTLRIAMMDQEFADAGYMSPHATREYLAWTNTLRRTLGQLGMKAAPSPTRSLSEHLASRQVAA